VGKRGNILSQSRQLAQHVLPAVIKPARTLWHEVIGFLFIVLAILPLRWGYKTYQSSKGDLDSFVKLSMAAIFVVVMAGYGISSFLRARKISRS
jgi:hypothetical protein